MRHLTETALEEQDYLFSHLPVSCISWSPGARRAISPKPPFLSKTILPSQPPEVFNLPAGCPEIDVIEVALRDSGSYLKSTDDLDQEVRHLTETALEEQDYRCVVVHLVTGSKTGYLIPSPQTLLDLAKVII